MARIKVTPGGPLRPVSNFIITRKDKQELSLSSDRNSLCRFSDGGDCLEDYGSVMDAARFIQIVQDFLAAEEWNTGRRRTV